MKSSITLFLFAILSSAMSLLSAQGFEGYYQTPDIHDDQIVFVAEGDLFTVPLSGGLATRLTTHAEEERVPKFSPDGQTISYSASYEGATEIYTIPVTGGLPTRWTYETDFSMNNGWTPDGEIVYDTRAYATLPNRQLITIDQQSKEKKRVPLSQASESSYDGSGETVYFVNPSFHGNVTKRYKGGTARQIWKYSDGAAEAVKLTTDYTGESHHPVWLDGRVYFLTDRDGIMNVWSMDESGGDLQQHTQHEDYDVRYISGSGNSIVYQRAGDIWHLDIQSGDYDKVDIRLISDMDQLQEKWVDNPSRYITSVYPDPKGEKVAITARGRAFVVPVDGSRTIEFTHQQDVRYRDAVFSADGDEIYMLSDESGEFEFISYAVDGLSDREQLTSDGEVLRYAGVPSPDGELMAYDDLMGRLYILDISTGESTLISTNQEGIRTFSWSPDSKWLAFVQTAENTMAQIHLYSVADGSSFALTTDRANSQYPQWSPDGEFIYFISDRSFTTLVGSPWGSRQPEPYFDASEKIYHIALQRGVRSPFRPDDELYEASEESSDSIVVQIDVEGIQERIAEVPIKAGNYRGLAVNDKAIYTLWSSTGVNSATDLAVVKITNEDPSINTMVGGARSFRMTADGKKILVNKSGSYYMVNAGTGKINDINDNKIDLSGWKFAISPQEDFRQIYTDAWRMERDYFYDQDMHGVDWQAMHDKYFKLIDRITTRSELSDLIGEFVGELSALHTSVRGGDLRSDDQNIAVANLGARLRRDVTAGGYVIEHIYRADPDYPDMKSPLDDPYLDVSEGDIITHVNGRSTLEANDIGDLLRNQVGEQVRLGLKSNADTRDIIVEPMGSMYGLRYRDWEYSRRLIVDEQSDDQIGYVHLQAMGRNDINQWYREFYPVFDRPGLIIDVRHNRGGNIESFILEKLLRKAWMYWNNRSSQPSWNMQYAFRGHIVILVDEFTASDGEAFADGFKKLDLGTAIGTRTWGGEIWLSGVNRLSDGGVARAPMFGVYDEQGNWLIEGHGFEPDIEVKNMPHETFNGRDAQLEAAIELLQQKIKEDPRPVPPVPPFPDKSFKNK